MGAVYPAHPGVTRSLTAPMPRMKRTAVSPFSPLLCVLVKKGSVNMQLLYRSDGSDPCSSLIAYWNTARAPRCLPTCTLVSLWWGSRCGAVFCIQATETALTFTSWAWKKKISSAATPPRCASTRRGSVTAPTTAGTTLMSLTVRVSTRPTVHTRPVHPQASIRQDAGQS